MVDSTGCTGLPRDLRLLKRREDLRGLDLLHVFEDLLKDLRLHSVLISVRRRTAIFWWLRAYLGLDGLDLFLKFFKLIGLMLWLLLLLIRLTK